MRWNLPPLVVSLALVLTAATGCGSYRPARSFVDKKVEYVGKVETPSGSFEIGRRKLMRRPTNDPKDDREVVVYGPVALDDAFLWFERVIAVPGFGLVGVEPQNDARLRYGSGLIARRTGPGMQSGAPGEGDGGLSWVERVVGADPLRPDHVLLVTNDYDPQFMRMTPRTITAYHKDGPPERFTGNVSLRGTHITETFADVTVVTLGSDLVFLGHDLRRLPAPPRDARRFPIFDPARLTSIDDLRGAYVVPSPANPALVAALKADGKFGVPPGSAGLLPVLLTYQYSRLVGLQSTSESTQAVICWIVPQVTEQGLRYGVANVELTKWSGPRFRDVRLQSGPELARGFARDVWLLAQGAEGTWEAIIPGPPPLGSTELPVIRDQRDPEAALAAGEAWMRAHNVEAAEAAAAAQAAERVRRAAEAKLRTELRQLEAEREARESFFGTENLIYGVERPEESLGQWIDGRQREAIKDMKNRGVYDAYGRPYDWLNKR